MKTEPEKTVSIPFTKDELWELQNNFAAAFQDGIDDNEIASRVNDKLTAAYKRAFT